MKTMNDGNNGSTSNNSSSWLGFSLSPHMKMEISPDPNHHHHHHHHHHHQFQQQAQASATSPAISNSVPTSFYLSSSQLNSSGLCYNVGGNGGFHSPLSVMPLKSDGSLCVMEALTRSHSAGIVPCSSPKLEDFLGGATIEAHQYGGHGRETMALSLDSIYYHQNPEHETNRPLSLDLLQDFSVHAHPGYYPGLGCHGLYQPPLEEENKDTHIADCDSQIPHIAEDAMPCLKNWVARHYSPNNAAMEPQVNSSMVDDGGASGSVGAMGCGDLQSLSLSMSPGSQSSCVTVPRQISPAGGGESVALETKKRSPAKLGQKQPVHRKSIDTFGQRTSQYRGVTRHRWTGRYEAHLWDNSCKKEGQTRKGRQVYLGGYDMEEKAARAYDLAALKYWGPSTHINFPLENYRQELEDMKNMSRQEYVAHLRRKSSGFSRGASMYRGVTRHHQHGRWQARIGRVAGNKDLYLGTFSTQEEAAEAYDIAAIKFRGVNAVTNFDITRYDVEKIMASNTLLAGELARRNKKTEATNEAIDYNNHQSATPNNEEEAIQAVEENGNGSDWKMGLYQSPPQHQQQPNAAVESLDQEDHHHKSIGIGNYRNQTTTATFSMALQNLIGIDDSGNPSGQMVAEPSKLCRHFSNPSSLVTSLNSSREASPDKTGSAMLFAKSSPSAMKFINTSAASVGSWFPSAAAAAQLRPAAAAISMAHLPVFAAWNDT